MILANPRKHTQQIILDVLNDDFQSYLCNPSVNREYKYKKVNDDISIYNTAVQVFTLLLVTSSVEIIQHTSDQFALAELTSFLKRRLQIGRMEF